MSIEYPNFPRSAPPHPFQHYVRSVLSSLGRVEEELTLSTVLMMESLTWEQLEAAFDNAVRVQASMARDLVDLNAKYADRKLMGDQHSMTIIQGQQKIIESEMSQWNLRVDILKQVANLICPPAATKNAGSPPSEPVAAKSEADWISSWKSGDTSLFDAD
jgi:hypothetical protein